MIYEEKDLVKCISLFVDVVSKMENKDFHSNEALSMGKEILNEREFKNGALNEALLDMESTLLH